MDRRTFLRTAGAGVALTGVAGCLTREDDDEEPTDDGDPDDPDLEGTLTVATYESMVDAENPAGPWLTEAFEAEYPEAEIEWTTPEDGVNQYVQRADHDAEIDADVYLGLNVDDLVRVDDRLGEGGLFRTLDRDRLDRADRVRADLEFDDPADRVLPYDTGYISLVYDETEVDGPETFTDLTEPEYEGTLLAQNAQQSDPGQAFLLWTIDAFGEDGYLDYWADLLENDVAVRGSWWDAYSAYLGRERPIVVSYSTDQVHSVAEDRDLSRHQIGFLNDQGYANPEGMAIFADSDQVDLGYAFLDFVLSGTAQAEIATRNVQFPAVTDEHVDLDPEFEDYAFEPPETVTFTYDELRGTLDGWIEDWARQVVDR